MTAEPSLLQRFGLSVTPQNVLGVRAVVLQEAQDLQDRLQAERERVMLSPLGADPISKDMSVAFNEVTVQLLTRANEHVVSLFKLGEELGTTARAYGHTDAEIAAAFDPGSSRTAASQISPTLLEAVGMGVTADRPFAQSVGGLLSGRTS
jgi:hypothetical protein